MWIPLSFSFLKSRLLLRIRYLTISFTVSNIQPLCFGLFGASLCGKLNVRRKMEDINICGTLQVQFLKVPVHEYDFYCFTIPHSKATVSNKYFICIVLSCKAYMHMCMDQWHRQRNLQVAYHSKTKCFQRLPMKHFINAVCELPKNSCSSRN